MGLGSFLFPAFISATIRIMEEWFQIPFANVERSYGILVNWFPVEVCITKSSVLVPGQAWAEAGKKLALTK